jgi:membrane protease subunit HflC
MQKGYYILVLAALVVLLVLQGGFYTVTMIEQAVVTRFGKPVRIVKEPGLKLKLPFVDKVSRFEKRVLEWDGSPEQIPTKDKKYILVDTFARWRISDPLQYFKRVRTEEGAQARLDDIVDSIARNFVSDNVLIEVVRNTNREFFYSDLEAELKTEVPNIDVGRAKLEKDILRVAATKMPEYGIELLDFRIKRVNYVEDVRKEVYNRMISERKRIAEKYRAEGKKAQEEIEGEKLKQLKKIESEAYMRSQEIRGEADAESTRIYAEAYSVDSEFYSFTKAIENYEKSFDADSKMLLSTDNEYLQYLKRSGRSR